MPPREEYEKYLDGIWEREYLTNHGPLVQQLERKLQEYLGVKHIQYVANGTIALQIAIKALGLKGEIITTPFSYVATTSSIVWEGCTPVFVDIDPNTLNINPELIEDAITDRTTGILATHVYGNPCDVEAIHAIAEKHNLKVIYDAAHCFGTTYKGETIFNWGDISTTSFHATKLFHTIEGGAVFSKNKNVSNQVYRMRNFGHAGFEQFDGVGINGKNSEFHAAMGLCNLNSAEKILQTRKKQCLLYDELLQNLPLQFVTLQRNSQWNYAYYPVIFESEVVMFRVKEALEQNDVHPRRYFYPSLDTLDYVKPEEVTVTKDISKRILCLPVFLGLGEIEIENITKYIINAI